MFDFLKESERIYLFLCDESVYDFICPNSMLITLHTFYVSKTEAHLRGILRQRLELIYGIFSVKNGSSLTENKMGFLTGGLGIRLYLYRKLIIKLGHIYIGPYFLKVFINSARI